MLENSREEQDLASTGKSVVVVSPGSGWFEVDYALSQITKQRMTDNGIGCDLVCCGSPPLHTVPLFTYIRPGSEALPADADTFRVPHWVLISFTDPPPAKPLPGCRLSTAPVQMGPLLLPHGLPALPEPVGLPSDVENGQIDVEAFSAAATADDPALLHHPSAREQQLVLQLEQASDTHLHFNWSSRLHSTSASSQSVPRASGLTKSTSLSDEPSEELLGTQPAWRASSALPIPVRSIAKEDSMIGQVWAASVQSLSKAS